MDEIKTAQKLTLNVLKKFIEICEENNLRYYFTGGALIGVLRHGGFIPWDDDIDIGMPRKDYERFLVALDTEMPNGFGICNRFTDKNWHFLMSQFFDQQSEVEIDLASEKRRAHIWIDVFPLDGLPSNSIERWFRIKEILFYRYLIQLANISTQVDAHRERPILEQTILKIAKTLPLGKIIDTDKMLDKLEKLLCKTDFYNSQYAGNLLGRYRQREVVPTQYFGTPKQANFEGIMVNIPAMSDELQTALYGDYMEMPPEKDRVAHNIKILRCRNLDEYEE